MRTQNLLRVVVAMVLVIGLALPSGPVSAAVTGEGHSWPSFNESRGCGQPQGFTPPYVSKTGFLSSGEVVGGPYGSFFGRTIGQIKEQLVDWEIPMSGGKLIQVHPLALPAFQQVTANLTAESAAGNYYEVRRWDTWGYAARTVNGSYRLSRHALGIALDINAGSNPYRNDDRLITDMPQWFVDAWRDAGFCWGGDWVDVKDPMHFSWMGPASTPGYQRIPTPVPPVTGPAGYSSPAAFSETQFAPLEDAWDYFLVDGNRDGALDVLRTRPWFTSTAVEYVPSSMDYRVCGMGDGLAPLPHRSGITLFGDFDGTSRPDLWSLNTSGPRLAMTVYSHASEYRDVADRFTTGVVPDPGDDYHLADYDRDGTLDLYVILRNAPKTAVQVWSGASGFTGLLLDSTTPLGSTGDESRWRFAIGDRDVDGIPDLYAIETDGVLTLQVLNGAARYRSIAETLPTGLSSAGISTIALSDHDGDGRDDLQALTAGGAVWVAYGNIPVSATPSRWYQSPTWSCSDRPAGNGELAVWADFYTNSGWTSQLVGDFDGDGRDDIANFHPSTGRWYVARSTGTGFRVSRWADFVTNSGWTSQLTGDFDGDGRDDIANFHPSTGRWYVARSTGRSFTTRMWADFVTNSGWTNQTTGDFNGDGRHDIANYHPASGRWYVARSTGTAFATSLWEQDPARAGWTATHSGGFNVDPSADLAAFRSSTGAWEVGISTGDRFHTSTWFTGPGGASWSAALVGDFNGDGAQDAASFDTATGRWYVGLAAGP